MRLGMLCAPLAYAFAVLVVVGLEGAWAFRGHAVAKRPRVLAAPAILLGIAGLWLLAHLSPPDRAAVLDVFWKRGWLLVVMFCGIPRSLGCKRCAFACGLPSSRSTASRAARCWSLPCSTRRGW